MKQYASILICVLLSCDRSPTKPDDPLSGLGELVHLDFEGDSVEALVGWERINYAFFTIVGVSDSTWTDGGKHSLSLTSKSGQQSAIGFKIAFSSTSDARRFVLSYWARAEGRDISAGMSISHREWIHMASFIGIDSTWSQHTLSIQTPTDPGDELLIYLIYPGRDNWPSVASIFIDDVLLVAESP